jgi:hypothetical protein
MRGMTFRVMHVSIGENPQPPPSHRRVLVSHSRWGDNPQALTEDQWGAVQRYQLGVPGARAHAERFAMDWGNLQPFPVEHLYLEIEPDA